MKVPVYCSTCNKIGEEREALFFEAEYNDLCIYSYECPLGLKTNFSIGIKFQTLFHIAISALKDGYYREAVASATSSLERFHELIIKVFLKKSEVDYDSFKITWKKVENLSERQIGAFYFLYLEHIKEAPQEFKGTSFRNKVVHKGKIPTKDEAEKYVKEVYEYIMNIKMKIKDKFKKTIEEVIEEEREINSKKFLELHKNEKVSGFIQPGRGYFIDLLIDTEDNISFEQKYERSQKGTVFY